jgi:hypothetical protein
MKECWHEIKGLPKPVYEEVWQGPIEERIAELKVKMQKFEDNVQNLKVEYEQSVKKQAAAATASKTTSTSTSSKAAAAAKKASGTVMKEESKSVATNFVKMEG